MKKAKREYRNKRNERNKRKKTGKQPENFHLFPDVRTHFQTLVRKPGQAQKAEKWQAEKWRLTASGLHFSARHFSAASVCVPCFYNCVLTSDLFRYFRLFRILPFASFNVIGLQAILQTGCYIILSRT
jgi:hypothetical protein